MPAPLTINVTQAAASAPLTYTVPASIEIEPLSAFAHFDGALAATAFRPTLTFYSASGLILARVFPSDTVVPGGTADVTFAPFLGGSIGVSNATLATVLDYVELGADVQTTAITEATATTVLTGNPIALDGLTEVEISVSVEMDCDMRASAVGASGGAHILNVWESGVDIGSIMDLSVSGIYIATSQSRTFRRTPAAGTHTYSIRTWLNHGAGVGFPIAYVYANTIGGSQPTHTNITITA